MPRATEKSNARRSRSFGGCGTCRRRHVKCDQVRPVCLTCKAIGATCEGFTAEIRWMSSSKDGNEKRKEPATPATGVSRRHLYSESDREKMSTKLAASFPIGTIDSSLNEIDNKSKESCMADKDISVGPFGVLNLNRPAVEPVAESETADDPMISIDQPPAQEPILDNVTPITMDSWMGLDDTLQWADLFGFGTDSIFPPSDSIFDPLLDLSGNDNLFIDPQALSDHDQGTSHTYNALAGAGSRLASVDQSTLTAQDVLKEAQMLLRHFKDTVVNRLVSLPVTSKSPWEIIIIQEAINTLGHLTYLESTAVTCAKKATLFGILAISAYHVSKNPPPNRSTTTSFDFQQIVNTASSEAKHNLQQSLKNELHGSSKAKYKDQLMAIECLLALAVIMGYQKDARCYLIDAERLMRHRGLAKREVSRKSRLLHHMYTWSRILGESTYVLHEYSSATGTVPSSHPGGTLTAVQPHVVHASGPGSRLDDFLRLEPHHADSELDIEEVKEPQTSLRDIHLEDSRDNPNTMYTEIYGINETWLSLLSQTTRLANRLDGMKATNSTEVTMSDLLSRRASRLEDMICSFAADFSPRYITPKFEPNNHMHTALNSALVIFFYRRIKNVNSWILQSHVDDVISALESFDKAIKDKPGQGPGTPWPAFIAAAEASTQNRRERLFAWIENGEAATGFHCYTSSKELLLETWKRRDENATGQTPGLRKSARRSGASQSTASWLDICREQKRWLMAF
ncbi:hypothetical protein M409DRAFT_66261 [Zasmidium cellare ATCC 36951]|uniref:Zn(2)-C6 fungal-type domain-containing protein n=1 Tax=Zasmidium cellare ATCC 36951 TaxID=1080233 RepID=A0A6A6CP35_ZASCE|nr:uncharacterized protein M409DRAFT_66261 [Zasmidium cellare ATCC 36951]KAF2167246.1 hypothetical protein M409DRAFT_66261 [Zasmidium cellare ATCC 36951]